MILQADDRPHCRGYPPQYGALQYETDDAAKDPPPQEERQPREYDSDKCHDNGIAVKVLNSRFWPVATAPRNLPIFAPVPLV